MRVTVRKGPPDLRTKECPVVVELWMTPAEARAHCHRHPDLDEKVEQCMEEHMQHRHRASRQLDTGRGHS